MSTTISMSFFPSEGNTVKAFASIIRRLISDAEVINSIKRHKKYWKYESPQLDLNTFISIIESPESECMVDSEDSFAVELGYTLTSGELIPLDINFYGNGYEMGLYARDDSNIRLTVQDSSLWSAIKTITRDMAWTSLDVPQHLKTAATEKVNLDTELLFLKACGFTLNQGSESYSWESEENYIDHAAIYFECGWSCPLRCQMVYHKNPQDFAKDFERIYADYYWGIAMPLLFTLKKDIWQLSDSEIASLNEYQLNKQKKVTRRCGKEYLESYKYFSRPQSFAPKQTELDIVNFIESLDKNKVQQLSSLPVSHIKEVFSTVTESELPEVRYRDFDEQGMVLLTGAYMSIWRAYLYLVELSFDYLK
jgi:hypothetical protein